MKGLRGVSLNNDIFMTGNIIIHKLLVINIVILQEDTVEDTVTTFYNSTLMMGLGKKLDNCSKADTTMVPVWSMLMMSWITVNNLDYHFCHVNIEYLGFVV